MRQHGCLDNAYGVWHPVLEEDDYPVQYWNRLCLFRSQSMFQSVRLSVSFTKILFPVMTG